MLCGECVPGMSSVLIFEDGSSYVNVLSSTFE